MNWRLGLLLALLLGCAGGTAAVIMTYRAPFDPRVERGYAEWIEHWKRSVDEMICLECYPEAERTIRNYLRYAPDDVGMRRVLGKVMCKNGNLSGAQDVYYAILLASPGDFVARNNLGVVLALRNRLEDARRELYEAFQLSGNAGFVGFSLSRVLEMLGERDEQLRVLLSFAERGRTGGIDVPRDALVLDFVADGDALAKIGGGRSASEEKK